MSSPVSGTGRPGGTTSGARLAPDTWLPRPGRDRIPREVRAEAPWVVLPGCRDLETGHSGCRHRLEQGPCQDRSRRSSDAQRRPAFSCPLSPRAALTVALPDDDIANADLGQAESRPSRITVAAGVRRVTRSLLWTRTNISSRVGPVASCWSSASRKADKLCPAVVARAISCRCNASGTFRTRTTLGMRPACSHLTFMSTTMHDTAPGTGRPRSPADAHHTSRFRTSGAGRRPPGTRQP